MDINPPIDPKNMEEYNKNAVSAKRALLDSVKDNQIPNIAVENYQGNV